MYNTPVQWSHTDIPSASEVIQKDIIGKYNI